MPRVQPANYESADPFDDPFGDGAAQATEPPPRMIQAATVRPIQGPGTTGPQVTPQGSTGAESGRIRLAQSEAEGDRPEFDDLDSLLQGGAGGEEPSTEPFEAQPLPAETDRPAPPAPDALTDEDLAPREAAPDSEISDIFQDADEGIEPPFDVQIDEPLESGEEPCDRRYGPSPDEQRNCCAEESECRLAKDVLRSKPISTISLDIAPPFAPKPQPETYDVDAQIKRLAKSQPRVWRDRRGNVLAQGRFVDFRSGQIVVMREDGTTTAVPLYSLGDDELCFVNAWWRTPAECRPTDDLTVSRNWQPMTFTWKASALCHKPLYFEQEQLERYGHSAGPAFQPFISATAFAMNLVLLPYHVGMNPPNECMYALGYYRPGSCAPWLVPAFPLSLRGAAYQAAAVAVLVPLPY